MSSAGINEKSYDESSLRNSKDMEDSEIGPQLTEAEYNRVLRKIDLHILPFVSLLYLLSFLWVTFRVSSFQSR
jgi:hypothetical protein